MFTPSFWRMRRFSESVPEILRLQQEMNRLFSSAGQSASIDYPAINVWGKDGAAVVTAELPGLNIEKHRHFRDRQCFDDFRNKKSSGTEKWRKLSEARKNSGQFSAQRAASFSRRSTRS